MAVILCSHFLSLLYEFIHETLTLLSFVRWLLRQESKWWLKLFFNESSSNEANPLVKRLSTWWWNSIKWASLLPIQSFRRYRDATTLNIRLQYRLNDPRYIVNEFLHILPWPLSTMKAITSTEWDYKERLRIQWSSLTVTAHMHVIRVLLRAKSQFIVIQFIALRAKVRALINAILLSSFNVMVTLTREI
jgi:hypothetical protein